MNYAGQRVRFFPLPKVPCALRQSPSTTYSYSGLCSPGRSYLTQLFNKCFRSAQYKTRTGCTKGTRYEMRTRDYGLSIKHGLGIHSPQSTFLPSQCFISSSQFLVRILYLVRVLYPVRSLQSSFYTDRFSVTYQPTDGNTFFRFKCAGICAFCDLFIEDFQFRDPDNW